MNEFHTLTDCEGVELKSNEAFRFACCDCGLVHDMVIVSQDDKPVGFAIKRMPEATAARRTQMAVGQDNTDYIGLALELESATKRVESQTVERAMEAAAHGLRLAHSFRHAPGTPPASAQDSAEARTGHTAGQQAAYWRGFEEAQLNAQHNAKVRDAASTVADEGAKDERQAFEAWAKKKKMPLARIGQQYDDFWVDHAWNGWQARASGAAPAAGDALEVLTDDEILDRWDTHVGDSPITESDKLCFAREIESDLLSKLSKRDAKDAARYRWWCDTGNDIASADTIGGKPTIDAAIDAAIAASQQGGE